MTAEQLKIAPLSPALCEPASRLIADVISDLKYYSAAARQAEILKYTCEKLHELIERDDKSVLLGTVGDAPAGFCISTYDDGVIWLAWFGVGKTQRMKGIGSRLLQAAIELVRPRGCQKIWCDSRTSNIESYSVLRRAGFVELCRLERHWYGHDYFLWEKTV